MRASETLSIKDNRLLAALPDSAVDGLRAHLEPVRLASGEVLSEPGRGVDHLYFPTSALVALIYTDHHGATAETGLVGNSGLTGIARLLGSGFTPNGLVVAVGGLAFRVPAPVMLRAFQDDAPLRTVLLRYAQTMMVQIAQTAVCNRLHHVDTRLCRWLLLARDCGRSDDIRVTQESMAHILGVRRECITHAVHRLQQAGLIRNTRGKVTILDGPGLEATACECYGVVRGEFERLLGRAG